MDGTLAVLFLVAGLTDMGFNHCGQGGCLAPGDADRRASLGYGNVYFQEDHISEEFYLRFEPGRSYGPFDMAVAGSVTTDGDYWIGLGGTWTAHMLDNQVFVQLSLLPGLHWEDEGPDLGSKLEFRSGIEVGYEAWNGIRYSLSYDHRSNAGLSSVNPGMETLQFRVSMPLN